METMKRTFFGHIKGLFKQYKGLSKTAYVLFFARTVNSMGALIGPMMTMIFTIKLGLSATYASYFLTGVSVLLLGGNFIGGKLADRFDKKSLIVIFSIISVLFFFACAIFQPHSIIIYLLAISSFFATLQGPAYNALISEATLPSERESVFSLAYLGGNLGFSFGALMAGLLFTNYLSLAFILDGTTTLFSTLLIVIFVKVYRYEDIKEEDRNEYEEHINVQENSFSVLKKRKSITYFVLIGAIGAFIYQQWGFTLPLYMKQVFGNAEGATYYGFVASLNGIVVVVFTAVMTYLLRKKFELEKMALGSLVMGLSFLIIFKASLLFLFFIFIFVFTLAEIINTIGQAPYMSRRVPASHRGRLSAFGFIGGFIGGNLGRLVSAQLIDNYGFDSVMILLIILGIIEAALLYFNLKLDKNIFPKLYITPPSLIQSSMQREKATR